MFEFNDLNWRMMAVAVCIDVECTEKVIEDKQWVEVSILVDTDIDLELKIDVRTNTWFRDSQTLLI